MAFDIRNALDERSYPTGTVSIWTDEEVFFRINAIEKRLAGETDKAKVDELDAALTEEYKRRDREALTVHLRATSPRAREDITTKAFVEHPIKRDVYNREDEVQAFKRTQYLKELIFAAHMTKIVTSDGDEQILEGEDGQSVVRAILDKAPDFSIARIDSAIEQLSIKADAERIASQEPDFLSKS